MKDRYEIFVYLAGFDHKDKNVTVVNLDSHCVWDLKELVLRGYEYSITPDGKVPKQAEKNIRKLIRLLQSLLEETKQERKDRFYTHILTQEIADIHQSMVIFREFVNSHLRMPCKDAHPNPTSDDKPRKSKRKDGRCKRSRNGISPT